MSLEALDSASDPGDLPLHSAKERFSGAYYAKVRSLVQVLEWVSLGCLRDSRDKARLGRRGAEQCCGSSDAHTTHGWGLLPGRELGH